MGFLDAIEKLINEHGSATILRERIGLANDKYAQLETSLKASEARNSVLQSEKERLEAQVRELRARVDQSAVAAQAGDLDEIAEAFLLLLAAHEDLSTEEVAGGKGVGKALAEFHLEELEKGKLVGDRYTMGSDWSASRREWFLHRAGRAYLARRGLLR